MMLGDADLHVGDAQLAFLKAALQRIKKEKFPGALLFAHHHPPYAVGSQHSSSTQMRQQMDAVCAEIGIWPHAVLSGHAHNYQRFTRHRSDGTEIPYIICGNGGHNVQRLQKGVPLRTPQVMQLASGDTDQVTLENYDDMNYGYLRIIAEPFHLLADDDDAAKEDMGRATLVVIGRKDGFIALYDKADPAQGDLAHGEDMLDHSCAIAGQI